MGLEIELDKFLKIKTNGRDDSNSNFVNYPYEPTPYCVLQALSNSGYINKRDVIIDFGCGKGRVDFFLAYSNKAKMIGVEYDERLYNRALDNLSTSINSNKVSFVNICASLFQNFDEVTAAYFFNPFSVEVLEKVIANIKKFKKDKEIKLFFYYPSKEYIKFLEEDNMIIYNEREYIAVYKI